MERSLSNKKVSCDTSVVVSDFDRQGDDRDEVNDHGQCFYDIARVEIDAAKILHFRVDGHQDA